METLDSPNVRRPAAPWSRRSRRRSAARVGLVLVAGLLALAAPAVAAAHQLTGRFTSPIPLGAYLAAAALAVGASFAIVFIRGRGPIVVPVEPPTERIVRVPRIVRSALVAVGAIAWTLIVIQVAVGGRSEGDAASLFLWTYGWVGLALASAFIGPIWLWLDPFATLHRLRSLDPASGGHRRRGAGGVPGSARSLAGRDHVHRRRLDGARAAGDPERSSPGLRAHRLHRDHARRDGPVRTRDVAPERRGLLGLVRSRRSAGPARLAPLGRQGATRYADRPRRAGGTPGQGAGPIVRGRPARARGRAGRPGPGCPVDRCDPVRWPVADRGVLPVVRAAVGRRADRPPARLARDHRRAGPGRSPGSSVSGPSWPV